MSYDQVIGAIKDIGVPTAMLVFILWGAWRVIQGPGSEVARALVTYLKTAHEQLLTLPGLVQQEAQRSRDFIERAHVETRAYVQSLVLGSSRPDDTPEPPTPQEPAVRRASGEVNVTPLRVLPPQVPPPPRRPMGSRPDLGENGDRSSSPFVPGRPPAPSRP